PAIGMAQPPVARREREDALSRLARLRAGLLHRYPQHLAIASRRNRQPMFKIPAGEAAFAGIVAQFDLAMLQRLAIGRAEDRQQHAAALAIGELIPVDVEGAGIWRSRSPFQHVEPPRIIGEMHADMVGDEVEDQADVMRVQRLAEASKTCLAAKFGVEPGVVDNVVAM